MSPVVSRCAPTGWNLLHEVQTRNSLSRGLDPVSFYPNVLGCTRFTRCRSASRRGRGAISSFQAAPGQAARWHVKELSAKRIEWNMMPESPTKGARPVWIASYPRSGNTFLRIILRDAFGLPSYSLYYMDGGTHRDPSAEAV